MAEKICPECNETFSCTPEQGKCWCFELPAVLSPSEAQTDCLCPECLKKKIADKKAHSSD